MSKQFSFEITKKLPNGLGRAGVIKTPHGEIKTPAFIPVGTKATVKAMTPEQVRDIGAQALLCNAYHLYLQPGHKLVGKAGGLHQFMNWSGPIFTDSGGFQVLSLGSGYKKTIEMDASKKPQSNNPKHAGKAKVTEDGVIFTSHLNGDKHKFTPELSMQIQTSLGTDIMFAFDELTSLFDDYDYQVEALERTHRWAERCVSELKRLRQAKPDKPYQALFGVLQGAQFEDLRRLTAKHLAKMDFDGFGIGGAMEKSQLGEIVRWVSEELPEDKPRHLLGLSEPNDIFDGIENGADTFDCVSPTRVGRNGSVYTKNGRIHIQGAKYKEDFEPIMNDCDCYTCANYTKAYLHHLFKAKEMLASTLASIHNERFIVKLVDDIRKSIEDDTFEEFKKSFLEQYY